MQLDEDNEVRKAIEPSIEAEGYEIVRIRWTGGNKSKTLQLMIEPKTGGITQVEDCEKVSRAVSAILDVEDIITDEYNLEVSSPGIDRPLTRLKDFDKFKGFTCKIETKDFYESKRKFRGIVKKVEGENIEFEEQDSKEIYQFPFSDIAEAKLVMTDELINAKITG